MVSGDAETRSVSQKPEARGNFERSGHEIPNLVASLDVLHGDELLGLLVPHQPRHPKVP